MTVRPPSPAPPSPRAPSPYFQGAVCGPENFRVELLSTMLAQERFDDYLAPSLNH